MTFCHIFEVASHVRQQVVHHRRTISVQEKNFRARKKSWVQKSPICTWEIVSLRVSQPAAVELYFFMRAYGAACHNTMGHY